MLKSEYHKSLQIFKLYLSGPFIYLNPIEKQLHCFHKANKTKTTPFFLYKRAK